MPTVVDDATLLALLSGRASVALAAAAAAGEVLTTGSWYYRLHRAIHDPVSAGSLSTMVANLPAPAKEVLYLRLDDLPPEIVLLGLRVVVPVMGALRVSRRVNHLTAEALAVALIGGAVIRVSTEAQLLADACRDLGIALEVRSPFE